MKLNNIITSIEYDINHSDPKIKLCIIYMAIGSATNLSPNEKVEERNYHQYPLCLQEIKNDSNLGDKVKTYHILIDPGIEDPPYMVTDRDKLMPFIKKDWSRLCLHK